MRLIISRRVVWSIAVLAAVLMTTQTSQVRAQYKLAHAPEVLYTSQEVNLYLSFEGDDRSDGTYLAIPSSWSLEQVRLVRPDGRSSEIPVRALESFPNRFVLSPRDRFGDGDLLVLRVRIGTDAGQPSIRLTPFRSLFDRTGVRTDMLDAFSLRQSFRVDESRFFRGNHVISFPESGVKPVSIRYGEFSELSYEAPFTIEFWMKTASSDAILMSTWDGSERSSYPIELLVDTSGHLVFFQGAPGEHRSMKSDQRVADGAWHHIAVAHDPDQSWSRLFIDGLASDSLFHASPLVISTAPGLVLSGRLSTDSDPPVSESGFSGYLDELRVWASARDVRMIRQTMRQPLSSVPGRVTVLGFEKLEEELPTADRRLRSVASNLSFYEPIRDLNVQMGVSSVILSWTATDPKAVEFAVEKSLDGTRYKELDRLQRPSDSFISSATRDNVMYYRDIDIRYGVSYYRVRQLFSDGTDRTSPSVKIGMGVEDDDATAVLTGNFPNPFNPTTTISYIIREAQHVRVSVWDLSGQMIAILVDESQDPGQYQVSFEAVDLPSGNYFIRMRTAAGIQTHQMVLAK